MSARKGNWIVTFTGRKFWPLEPHADEVSIVDIAHALANVCRFGGHCREFYSVAEHSVRVSWSLPTSEPVLKLQGLLHDATEAYIGDMVRPLKYSMPEYLLCEDLIWLAICEQFKLPRIFPRDIPVLKTADNRMLLTERRDLCTHRDIPWEITEKDYPPHAAQIQARAPTIAERLFLMEFNKLEKQR